LPRCTATLRRCRRKSVACGSSIAAAIRRPTSHWKSAASTPRAPVVSMATRLVRKHTLQTADCCHFFVTFFVSASVATATGPVTARARWPTAKVYGHMKSHTRQRPSFQGTRVRLYGLSQTVRSGRLPSSRVNAVGSNRDETFAAAARFIMSLTSCHCHCTLWFKKTRQLRRTITTTLQFSRF